MPTIDYQDAERFLPGSVSKLVHGAVGEPHWLDDDRFWYGRESHDGLQYFLADPAQGTVTPLTDEARRALAPHSFAAGEMPSPDGAWALFVRDHDLYVRAVDTGDESRLTFDGEPDFAYAAQLYGEESPLNDWLRHTVSQPVAVWSPDSTRVLTHRIDHRNVEQLHLLQMVPPDGSYRPVVHSYRYALPGDEHVPLASLLILDVITGARVNVQMEPTPSVVQSPVDDGYSWWSVDADRIYLLRFDRLSKVVELIEVEAASGETRTLLTEQASTDTYVEVTPTRYSGFKPNVRVLDSGEIIWWSERDGWGHLYLIDSRSGVTIRQITTGPWQVRELLHVDERERRVLFTAGGAESGRNPYYCHLYAANLDGDPMRLLTPDDAHHEIHVAPGGRWFVDRYSRVDAAPVAVVRDVNGAVALALGTVDIAPLLATGWRRPEPFVARARDGVTEIHGLMLFPTDFDPERRYPVVDYIYPGPCAAYVPVAFPSSAKRGFWFGQALAQLGFIVVMIDGMGTGYRSRAFQDVAYGRNFGEAGGIADHVTALRQLAATRPYLDLDRVGIYGISGGGYAAARAILEFPDFFKVAVSYAGNHDQRLYHAAWGEQYVGWPEGDLYDPQANAHLASNLVGKLLLIAGDMDGDVHPAATFRLAAALIEANKTFDMLIVPNGSHDYNYRRHP